MVRVLAGIAAVAFGFAFVPQKSGEQDTTKVHPISAQEAGIGRALPKLTGKTLEGRAINVANFAGNKPVVIALTSTTCPIARKLAPTLAKLEKTYAEKGVAFIFLNPEENVKSEEVKTTVNRVGLGGTYVVNSDWTEALGAKTTTEVFFFDATRKLAYRGAVDDQYGVGASLPEAKTHYLALALDAVLAGKTPAIPATWAPGCVLQSPSAEEMAVTYYADIAAIINEKCLSCHREGGVGPFKLDSYDAVKSRAPMIKYVVEKGIMPPWFAKHDGPSPFKNDRSLSAEEKNRLFAWIDAGTPAGKSSDAPKAPTFDLRWETGKPDHIIRIPQPYKVNATGVMPYKEVVVPTGIAEDKWIRGMEVRPSARQVVHHVLIFIREKGQERKENPGEEINGFFAAYVPGTSQAFYPDGFAKKLPGGASLKFQIHYTPNGEAAEDQTELGLHFADGPIKQEVHTAGVANVMLAIPPGAEHHPVSATIPVPFDGKIMTLIPHMHVRGSAARFDLTTPDGKSEMLLDVPKYDFNWQLAYEFKKYVDIPKGSRIKFTAWYNNSDKNPHNPDPKKTVRWGEQTFDEMHLGYIEYFVPGLKPGDPVPGISRGGVANIVTTLFSSMDKDGDGFVTEAEAGIAWNRLKIADANGDGKLTLEEAKKLFGGQ